MAWCSYPEKHEHVKVCWGSIIFYMGINQTLVSIGNSMICSDIWHKYHSDVSKLLYVISWTIRWLKFETILKYH